MAESISQNPTLEVLSHRASCRHFDDRDVPPEVVAQLVEAGTKAASGGNLQPYSIITIRNEQAKSRLAELCFGQRFMVEAPVLLLFCIDWHRVGRWAAVNDAPDTTADSFRHFWISMQDVAICAQSVAVAADSAGMASVYVGAVLECLAELRQMFALPERVLPVVFLCLGYRAGSVNPQPKHGPAVVVHEERYHDPDDETLAAAMAEKYNWTKPLSPELESQIADICRKVAGPSAAQRCRERMRRQGFINPAQWYFGVRYPADRTARGNDKLLQTIREFGFGWFDRFQEHGTD